MTRPPSVTAIAIESSTIVNFTIQSFAQSCRDILLTQSEEKALPRLQAYLHQALNTPSFLNECFAKADWIGRKILYEDKDTHFCLCAHINHNEVVGKPHDHGSTWAIYGQAAGETVMTEWRVITPASDNLPAKVEPERTYKLKAGDVHLYKAGAIHSPVRKNPARLIRIEGRNLDTEVRRPYIPVSSPSSSL